MKVEEYVQRRMASEYIHHIGNRISILLDLSFCINQSGSFCFPSCNEAYPDAKNTQDYSRCKSFTKTFYYQIIIRMLVILKFQELRVLLKQMNSVGFISLFLFYLTSLILGNIFLARFPCTLAFIIIKCRNK